MRFTVGALLLIVLYTTSIKYMRTRSRINSHDTLCLVKTRKIRKQMSRKHHRDHDKKKELYYSCDNNSSDDKKPLTNALDRCYQIMFNILAFSVLVWLSLLRSSDPLVG